jgi:prolyl-tRNA synthetase
VRITQALIRTQKEDPADAAGVSHVLLTRAGYIRKVGAGIYDFLPLGLRVLRKIERIVREEMDRAGAQEVLMPALLPAEYFQETGRFDGFGDTLFRLQDRKKGDYHLGPTHEEIVTDMVRREVKSYRDLPQNLYQIQSKFRDEPRPRAGLLRCREFLMKDAYSFDIDEQAAVRSYERMRDAYHAIFKRLGLDYRMVAADSGAMGGDTSAEFQVLVQSGEDFIAVDENSDYAANLEVASAFDPRQTPQEPVEQLTLEKVDTPKTHTIDAVAKLLKREKKQILKSMVYLATVGEESQVVMAVVRGDHEVNEIKLARAIGAKQVFLAGEADVKKATGAPVGYAGPHGFTGTIWVDRDASLVPNAVIGANQPHAHFINANFGRDFTGEVADIRSVVDGDIAPNGTGKLKVYRGIEAGHIFILGTYYTEKMNARFLAEDGSSKAIIMGCYGIGVSRLIATVVEQHNDSNGIAWPQAIAPFQVHMVTLSVAEEVHQVAQTLKQQLEGLGIDVLWDDRHERPGVKFKDADLIGIPWRVTIGDKGLAKGIVELKSRTSPDPKAFDALPVADAATEISQRIQGLSLNS